MGHVEVKKVVGPCCCGSLCAVGAARGNHSSLELREEAHLSREEYRILKNSKKCHF